MGELKILVENYLQEASDFATLAGILGGFAFSAVVQLLASDTQRKVLTATIVTFEYSSILSFYAVVVFVLALAATAETNTILLQVDSTGNTAMIGIFGGIYVFPMGVALSGWHRSRAAGIATFGLSLITMRLTSVALIQIDLALPVAPCNADRQLTRQHKKSNSNHAPS
ncbi:MAG: hypothetical protein IPJ46_20320 [Anaerolineales bacterium]|nr:hypothetical protein [Anaerolineales bacterium]